MNLLSNFFNLVFFKPLLNALVFIIGIIPFHDVGSAIIVLTIVVRFLIFPLNHHAITTQIKMKQLEPELKEIKEKFKKDAPEQSKRVMELYKQHGINPLSGFLNLIIQLPIIFALYKVFTLNATLDPLNLYSFIHSPENIQIKFLNIFDITKKSYLLAFVTGATQFLQMRLALPPISKKDHADFAQKINMQMRYLMPLFVFFIVSRFASAIAVYWTTMNIFAIIHESIVRRKAMKMIEKNEETKQNNRIIHKRNSKKIND
ncbi:MAG: YidC/Oxa1 family membrane protein insertase [Patescibacteria group bacterium]